MQLIQRDGITYALIVRSQEKPESSKFYSPNTASLQLGAFSRPKGFIEEPHSHAPIPRQIKNLEQVLFLTEGKVRISFYEKNGQAFQTEEIHGGDLIVLMDGIHGLELLEDTRGWSVKQGPFLGDEKDKVFLKATV